MKLGRLAMSACYLCGKTYLFATADLQARNQPMGLMGDACQRACFYFGKETATHSKTLVCEQALEHHPQEQVDVQCVSAGSRQPQLFTSLGLSFGGFVLGAALPTFPFQGLCFAAEGSFPLPRKVPEPEAPVLLALKTSS